MTQKKPQKKDLKINTDELKEIQNAHKVLNTLKDNRNFLCVNKELELKKFNKNFDHLTVSIENQTEVYKSIFTKLEGKYGKGIMIDLQTGIINPQPDTKPLNSSPPEPTPQ